MKRFTLKRYFFALFLLPLSATLFVACSDDDDHVTIMVAAEKADCGTAFGVGPNCLYIKGDRYTEWSIVGAYYIADFKHDEGYEYKLEVKKTSYNTTIQSSFSSSAGCTIPIPYTYTLVRIISKEKKQSSLDS